MVAESFTCPRCWRVSHHPEDVAVGYCGHCHEWTGPSGGAPVPLVTGSGSGEPPSPDPDVDDRSTQCDLGFHERCGGCGCSCHASWDVHAQGWLVREIADGRAVWVMPFLYTHAIVIGPPFAGYYDDRWCYATRVAAIAAAIAWDAIAEAEPTGWHRHPSSGRRRAGGDPALEVIAP